MNKASYVMRTRVPLLILIFTLTTPLILSCEPRDSAPDVDPQVGRKCFDLHLASLPPGTQYEGFKATADRITVKVMTGAKLENLGCLLKPDGTLDVETSARQGQTVTTE